VTARADLVDLAHAGKVLAQFGKAFGQLPENPGDQTKEQDRFLDEAVAGLAGDGKIISVRLSLFAEMVKGRPWTPATLRQVGGTEGGRGKRLDSWTPTSSSSIVMPRLIPS
jgi:eukaryotic-like serine/threonine-protein kinase